MRVEMIVSPKSYGELMREDTELFYVHEEPPHTKTVIKLKPEYYVTEGLGHLIVDGEYEKTVDLKSIETKARKHTDG